MTLAVGMAVALFVGIVIYSVLGGADFGSGAWDLLAGDASHGGRVRALIDRSIGPVWEANHVWLIYVLVMLWTAFPRPFVAITTTLAVPLSIAALGIVLRGAGFAFRKFSATISQARLFGIAFAASSVLTPFFLGAAAGAVASGRVPQEGAGDPWRSWTGPTSLVGGSLAVLTCSFLAATFLAADAERAGSHDLAGEMARGALRVGLVTGAVALGAAATLERDAPTLAAGLHSSGLPLVIASAVGGLSALWWLRTGRYRRARIAAAGAVAAVVLGWGVGQYPWVLVDEVTIAGGAGADATLTALLVVVGLATVLVLPPLIYLLWLTQQPSTDPPSR
ncbi:cytochrome d ubiquinol oxidase subunit II [Aquihabitans sp. G128]|uniref:cytochrome d ubiquinol oxidase subunit II n=1 Tax=Aquihabitans sp. G128 TaxID=2849779 RepID=UPI001C236AFC|nr:cytochrome d ubiquinol oxidase subunit II [Aquihabitans sp. G128]QXC60601.1 cytochrome d ubiquinol oxidase subunit II [Aquihabitans sp. G128]